jgi:hypothetical protein
LARPLEHALGVHLLQRPDCQSQIVNEVLLLRCLRRNRVPAKSANEIGMRGIMMRSPRFDLDRFRPADSR